MESHTRFPQVGFTLVELILVIVVIGVLAAASLKYYVDLHEQAVKTGHLTQARYFTAAVQIARAEWLLGRPPEEIPTAAGKKMAVDLGGTNLYVNEMGWPANSSVELDSSSESQTAAECYELWFALMANPMPATIEGLQSLTGAKGEHQYHISMAHSACRYELVSRLGDDYFFDYDLKTGKVLISALTLD